MLHSHDFQPEIQPSRLNDIGPSRVFTLMPSSKGPRPEPLTGGLGISSKYHSDHMYEEAGPEIAVYAVSDHLIGGEGIARCHDSIFFDDRILPGYYQNAFTDRDVPIWIKGLFNPDQEVIDIDHPVAMVLAPNQVYGHFLLEMLPKLWTTAQLVDMGVRAKIVISTHNLPWVTEFCKMFFSEKDFIYYNPDNQIIRAPVILMPSRFEKNYSFHPVMNVVMNDIVKKLSGPSFEYKSSRRIWLSRRGMHNSSDRVLTNIDDVEIAAIQAGFDIVRPQKMSISEQVRMYANCAILAGEYGSGLHNALFMPPRTSVVSINRFNHIQGRLAALRQQFLSLIPPSDGVFREDYNNPAVSWPFSVDLDNVKRAFDVAIACSTK